MNDQYQPYSDFTPPPVRKNAAYYRAKARTALKPCYGNAILVSALAGLLGGSVAGGVTVSIDTSSLNSEKVTSLLEKVRTEGLAATLADIPMLPMLVAVFAFAMISSVLFSLFVSAPVMVGYQRYNLNVIDGKGNEAPVRTLFSYFKRSYKKSIGLYVLYTMLNFLTVIPMLLGAGFFLYAALRTDNHPDHTAYLSLVLIATVVFLICTMITVVLMFLVQYRYYFSFLILAEYPEIRVIDALRNSATLMKGNKWRLFCLQISFTGWALLAAIFTFGIGMILLSPYIRVAETAFYDDIANRAAAKEAEFPSLDPDDYSENENEQDWWTQQQ